MQNSPIGRLLWLAVHNTSFRRTAMTDLGAALSEAAVLLSDREMAELRAFWETVTPLADRAAMEAIQRHARLHYMPLVEEESELLPSSQESSPTYLPRPLTTLDASSLADLKAAHVAGDRATFERIVAANAKLRSPREPISYALIEVRNGRHSKLGWCEVGPCAHMSDARTRIASQSDGLYRLIAVKRSLLLRRSAAGLDFYPLPARKLILERWAGEPTVERPDTDWLRVGYPPDCVERSGLVYETLVGAQGPLETEIDAEAWLQDNGQPGTYRIITLNRIYRRRTSRSGKTTVSAHYCPVPDDGGYPELAPQVFL